MKFSAKLSAVICSLAMLAFAGCSSKENSDKTPGASSSGTTAVGEAQKPHTTKSAKELFNKAKAAMGEMPVTTSLDEEMFYEFYGKPDGLEVEEFICEIPSMNVHATEITVVRFSRSVSEDEAEEFFKKRQTDLEKQWENYLPEQYDLVKDYVVAANGDCALFCIGERADEAKDAFEEK